MNGIKQKLLKLFKLDLVKIFSLTSISTFVRMIGGFISVKFIAVLIGPTGVALLGQLNNFTNILMTISTAGMSTGIIKYVSENRENEKECRSYINTALLFLFILTIFCSLVVLIGAPFFSKKVLLSEDYIYVFIIFGLTLIFYTLNNFLLNIINGMQQYKLYVELSIISSIVCLLLSVALVYFVQLKGALINTVINQSVLFFINIGIIKIKKIKMLDRKIFDYFSFSHLKKLLAYSLMSVISLLALPSIQLFLRSFIMDEFGIVTAGCWEGMNKLSNMYLTIITSSLGVYYLPKLSSLKTNMEIKQEILSCFKLLCPLMIIGFSLIFIMRGFLTTLLFSESFTDMNNFFIYQLIGDFFKITSWLLAYVMVARAWIFVSIVSELFFDLIYVGLSYVLAKIFGMGINGVMLSYTIYYFLYLLFTIAYVWIVKLNKKEIGKKNE